jgi:hypothetical protein
MGFIFQVGGISAKENLVSSDNCMSLEGEIFALIGPNCAEITGKCVEITPQRHKIRGNNLFMLITVPLPLINESGLRVWAVG